MPVDRHGERPASRSQPGAPVVRNLPEGLPVAGAGSTSRVTRPSLLRMSERTESLHASVTPEVKHQVTELALAERVTVMTAAALLIERGLDATVYTDRDPGDLVLFDRSGSRLPPMDSEDDLYGDDELDAEAGRRGAFKVTATLKPEISHLLAEHAMKTSLTLEDTAAILIEQALSRQEDQG
jgi:hypothetical protein